MNNLVYDEAGRLALEFPLEKNAKPFYIDFLHGKLAHRKKHRSGQELLIRAIGGPPSQNRIIDATAGLGRDAFIIASYGYPVLMLERCETLAALLADALKRLRQECAEFSNFDLLQVDAVAYLQQLKPGEYPEVVYLDPMFPDREKTALVKKELRIVRSLAGPDTDSTALFAMARTVAKKRVIVKRPIKASFLTQDQPSFSLTGKVCRFDVYVVRMSAEDHEKLA